MKKIFGIVALRKYGFILLLLIVKFGNVFSQNELAVVQKSFETYTANNYQEKVFLHTDKTVYTTGEVLWFKAYVTNAATNKFSSLSKICYVEILTADKKALLQGKISIDSGRGNGSFLLTASIRSGNYILRAYTNWMKNFAAEFYFEQPVSIINTNKKPEAKKMDSPEEANVQFFPEGGNLVYGLNNNVAYKINDAFGKGINANGFILTDKNDTAAKFATENFGMGSFSFIPAKGTLYHAFIQSGNTSFVKDLPQIYNEGWVLHVANEGNTLLVTVNCNVATEHSIFLFVQTRNVMKLAAMQAMSNGSATFTINKAELGEGISQLTIFNEKKQPVCERLYFKKPVNVLQIKLDDIQAQYEPRKRITINMATDEPNGTPINADISVAVYLLDSLQPEQKNNILYYLWLTSDLKGFVEAPNYYFENSGAAVVKATDNLMLTQGWRRFNWDKVLKSTKPSFSFLPEYEGHIITGKLSPKIAGLKDTGVVVYLSVSGKDFKFLSNTSLANGFLQFNVQKFYGSREVIVQTNAVDSNYRIFIDNPFSEQYADNRINTMNVTPAIANEIMLRSIGAQALNIYQPGKENNFSLPAFYDSAAFFGTPFKQYNLDAYTRFPTMEEVMKEYVKEVHVRKKDKNFHYEVFNEPYLNYFDNDPLVLIDGVPVFDVTKIINMDPLKIEKVDIVASKFFQGNQQYDGIVSYATYNGDLDTYQLDPNSLVVEYEGLQLEREFYSPQYETSQQQLSRLPDYRNVLYWSPQIKTINGKQNINFYTSDIPGKYIMLVEGLSETGVAGFATATFTVSTGEK